MTNPTPAASPRLWPMATVMSAGVFATTFVQLQGLGYLPLNDLLNKQMGLNSDEAATFFSICTLPWAFKYIAGLIVDSVPLFGSRRRSYLILSALSASALWLAMGLVPGTRNSLLVLAFAMNVAIVFGSTTAGGLLVEAGQTFGASGKLSSLRVFAQNLGAALGLPLGGLLAGHALGWTSLAAILPLMTIFFTAWFLLREPAPAPVLPGAAATGPKTGVLPSIIRQIKNVLRREMLWPAALIFFIQAVPTFRSTCFYEYQTRTLNYSDAALGWLGLAGYGVALLSSGLYVWICRKIPLRISLFGTVVVTSLSALPYLFYPAYTPCMPGAMAIEGIGTFLQYLAYLPLFDLVTRTAPKGSEALGYSILIGVWNLGLALGSKTGPSLYEHVLAKNMNHLIWLNAGVTLLGIFLIFLLPKNLVDHREGK